MRMHRRSDGRMLVTAIVEADEESIALAIEAGDAADVAAVLGDHAHDVIGRAPTVRGAQILATRYARAWAAGESLSACSCGSVDPRSASVTSQKVARIDRRRAATKSL